MDIKNSFLADTINTLTELGKKAAAPTFHDVNGRTFLVTGSDYTEVEPPEIPKPEKVSTRSLNALVALIKSEVDSQTEKPPLYVSCNTYSDVEVFTTPNPKDELHRWQPYHATASDLPPLVEDVRWSFDEAMIKLDVGVKLLCQSHEVLRQRGRVHVGDDLDLCVLFVPTVSFVSCYPAIGEDRNRPGAKVVLCRAGLAVPLELHQAVGVAAPARVAGRLSCCCPPPQRKQPR